MPEFNGGDDAGGLHSLEVDGTFALSGLIQETPLPMADKAGAEDFLTQLDRLAEKVRDQQYSQAAELKIAEVIPETGLVDESALEAESQVDRRLREARQLIGEEKFQEALEPLAGVLKEVPDHPEALYLMAYCHYHLDEDLQALRVLAPLRGMRLDRHLANRVEALRTDICQRLFLHLILETILFMHQDDHEEAIARLREVVDLAPESGIFHFMLAGSLMTAERFWEALEAVNYGLSAAAVEHRDLLETLKGQIQQQFCTREMEPARALFKRREYRKARAVLQGLNAEYRTLPLYAAFEGYLTRLGGGMLGWLRQRNPREVQPPGSFADVDALYFFLVGQEIRGAKGFIEKGNIDQALNLLRQVLQYCPLFPYANFLYGGCLYRWVGERIAGNDRPELEELISALTEAQACLRLAMSDGEITEASQDLLKRVEEPLRAAREVQEELARRREEASYVNAVIQEFEAIMRTAKDGIQSPAHHRKIFGKMQALKAKLPSVGKRVRSADGREAITKLSEAVERNLRQLANIEKEIQESEIVKGNIQKFNGIMDSIPGRRITTYQQLNQLRQSFRSLKEQVEADKRKLRGTESKNTLDQLLEAVNRHLRELDK